MDLVYGADNSISFLDRLVSFIDTVRVPWIDVEFYWECTCEDAYHKVPTYGCYGTYRAYTVFNSEDDYQPDIYQNEVMSIPSLDTIHMVTSLRENGENILKILSLLKERFAWLGDTLDYSEAKDRLNNIDKELKELCCSLTT